MTKVGVRELKERVSDIIREVREEHASFLITHRGTVVARLVPVREVSSRASATASVWADMDTLAEEIGAAWQGEASAVEAVADVRREL